MFKTFKQNVLECICIALAVVLLCSVFFSSFSFADSSYDSSYAYSLPVVLDNSSSVTSSGIHLYNYRNEPVLCGSTSPDTFVIFIADGKDWLVFNTSQSFKYCWINTDSSIYSSYSSYSDFGLDYVYFHDSGSYAQWTDFLNLKTVPDFDSALSLALSFTGTGVSVSNSFTIPNGWIYFFTPVNPDEDVNISATFPQKTAPFSNTWSPNTIKWERQTSTSPTLHNPLPWSSMDDLTLVGYGDSSLLGQFSTGKTSVKLGSGTYLCIYNPSYRVVNINNASGSFNPTLTVSAESGFSFIRAIPLKESLTSSGFTAEADSSAYQDYIITDDSDPENPVYGWVKADGTTPSEAPQTGGNNSIPEQQTISDYLNQVIEVLTNFSNNFVNLLKGPISHISQLINAGSGFMDSLRGLYAWLPVDIQGIIVSALTVIIAIGVFKVFL